MSLLQSVLEEYLIRCNMQTFKEHINLTESGDLQILHTAAAVPAPKIHKTEQGHHVAVHQTSTAEHANWLKGKLEKAKAHNAARAHISIEASHNDGRHTVTVTHKVPEKKAEKK